MSWFKDVLGVVSSIGQVAGALAGGVGAGNMLHMGPRNTGEHANLGQIIFLHDDSGNIAAFNQSTTQWASLDFPGDALTSMEPQTIWLKPTKTTDVSKLLVDYSTVGIDEFTMRPAPPGYKPVPAGTFGLEGNEETPVRSSSLQPMQSGIEVSIGSYFTAKLNASDSTVRIAVTGTLTLGALLALNVRGARSTAVQILNAVRKSGSTAAQMDADDDEKSITVDLPAGLDLTDGLIWIDIFATVGGLQPDEWVRDNDSLIGELSANEKSRVEAFAARQA